MGMYTTTDYCDLQMRDNSAKNREEMKEIESEETGGGKDWLYIDKDTGNVELEVDWNLHGYWYEDTLTLLENLNKYIHGSWYLTYEEGDKVVIRFPDEPEREVEIEIGYIQWARPKTLTEFTNELRQDDEMFRKALNGGK